MPKNPNWTWEELVLLLDLFFQLGRRAAGPENAQVTELSDFLNRLSIHPGETRNPEFRNPTGISMKLGNLLRLDPSYGKGGLTRGGQLEEAVWEEYANNPERLRRDAAKIRSKALGTQMGTTQNMDPTATWLSSPSSHMSSDAAVNWIRFLRRYGPIANNENMYDEQIQRSARRAKTEPIRFVHPRLEDVMADFLRPMGPVSVILTGTAGDGKTHLCRCVWQAVRGDPEAWASDDPYLTTVFPGGDGHDYTLHVIRDLSAWAPQTGADWEPARRARLEAFSESILQEGSRDIYLMAANDGQLIESWRRLPSTPAVCRSRELFETLLVEDKQEEPGVQLKFYNMSRGSSAALFDRAIQAFVDHPAWHTCYELNAGPGAFFGPDCPIRHNYELLRSPLVVKRIRNLLSLCDYSRLHLPVRQILLLLANAVLGHPDVKERLMVPGDVPKLLQANKRSRASLYSNLFGGNLTEARRESLTIFDYLNRFRIGHETSNRIDNILIYGGADPEFRPYFDALLATDAFYGADPSFRAAQREYIEGATEDDEWSDAFLEQLVSQRRGLFFKIPEDQEQDLRLWELTVFQYAGEYLDRVVGVLQAGGRIERAILQRMVRGLNRIFTGMLVSADRDLYLATGLSVSHARVSRLLREQISVTPRRGEKVEIVWKDDFPTLVVSLDEDTQIALQLHLTRYEFLSRVAEGALPSSFSRECYEDVLAYKVQVLAGLSAREGQDTDPDVVTFRLLSINELGNPHIDDVEIAHV